jgi:hypothetical protein
MRWTRSHQAPQPMTLAYPNLIQPYYNQQYLNNHTNRH